MDRKAGISRVRAADRMENPCLWDACAKLPEEGAKTRRLKL